MNEIALPRKVSNVVDDYQEKLEALPEVFQLFEDQKQAVEFSTNLGGYVGSPFNRPPYLTISDMEGTLLKSAWQTIYNMLNIASIAPAKERKQFEMSIASPPPFTADNVIATFGDYVENSRQHILRGLAEVFCNLDSAYKSHSNVRVGVKGLPKRVIISGVGGWGSYGIDRLADLINALNSFDSLPHISYGELHDIKQEKLKEYRGLTFKMFANGNCHVHFSKDQCRQINLALAEFYGEVLPDVYEHADKPAESREVSKDLQYYPTPSDIVRRLVTDVVWIKKEHVVLEPSCGCGRIMDELRDIDKVIGIEYDAGRAAQAKAKGHAVMQANFLEMEPKPEFDRVIMNPPFYGKHYLKHIKHAIKFLKEDGILVSILPATAHYDHKELPEGGRWTDLPVGAFSESGTNVPTGYWVYKNR